jgi:hypothetical protein
MQLLEILEAMTAEEYENHLLAISSKLTEKFKNLNQGTGLFYFRN